MPSRACPVRSLKTTTFVAALRHDRPTAPCVFDGPINGKKFRAYVGQILVPDARRAGDLEVMDNLASHEVASIGQAIEGVGAEGGFLPPYSPHLEPIDPVLAIIGSKNKLRKMGRRIYGLSRCDQ